MRTQRALSTGWRIRQLDAGTDSAEALRLAAQADGSWLPTNLPAQVHDVLLAHGRIPDPRVGRNAAESAWVGVYDWAYACRFASPPHLGGPIWLRCEGLDTLGEVYLNNQRVGLFANMHLRHAMDVREALRPVGEENDLLILFRSPLAVIDKAQSALRDERVAAHKILRKCHSDFSSYLGARPRSVKVGVYRDILLDVAGPTWLEDVQVQCRLAPDHAIAEVRIGVEIGGGTSDLEWEIRDPGGHQVTAGRLSSVKGCQDVTATIPRPELWWPWTHGQPNLYRLNLLLRRGEAAIDQAQASFGIRHIEPVLQDPDTGEMRFAFKINGRQIFLRGANWTPVEGMTHCWDALRADRLLDLAQHARMNVLRVWGEGYIPPQEFYEECDRRGILVWQDFMFGYGMYPEKEEGFLANCRAEADDTVRRLRNHPCILLWCGGNENHMGWNFLQGDEPAPAEELFRSILPDACRRLDPLRLFHHSSPSGGPVPNWPLEGDWHDYSTLSFCPQASVPLFASEVGRVSAPCLASMEKFLAPGELWPDGHNPIQSRPGQPAWPPMWRYRSVDGSWAKIGAIEEYATPTSAEELIRVLGTAHGEYLRCRVERERRGRPDGAAEGPRRCWGNMVWRLNDPWPILYWSVIDYYLSPKIAYYYLRRAYDPVLVSFEQTDDRLSVWITNDSFDSVAGRLTVSRLTFDGQTRGAMTADVEIASGNSRRVLNLDSLGPIPLRTEFLEAEFAGRRAVHLLHAERYLELPDARLELRFEDDVIVISSTRFACQVELRSSDDDVFEDNWFDLVPGHPKRVAVLFGSVRSVVARAVNAAPVLVSA